MANRKHIESVFRMRPALTALAALVLGTAAWSDYYVTSGPYTGTGLIYRFADDGTPKGTFGTDLIHNPIGFTFLGDDTMVVCNYGDQELHQFHADGTDMGVIASGVDANSILVDSYGDLLVTNYNGDQIRRFSTTGLDLGVFAAPGFSRQGQLVMDPDGNIFTCSFFPGEQAIYKYDPDGNFLGVFSDYAQSGILSPTGLALMPDGTMLSSNTFNNTIDHLDTNGDWLGTFSASGMFEPEWLTLDASGDVLLPSWSGGYVERYDSVGNDLGPFVMVPHCYQILSGPDVEVPDSFNAIRGAVTSGNTNSLAETDGDVLRLFKSVIRHGDSQPPMKVDFHCQTSILNPSALSVAVTSQMATAGSFNQEIVLLDKDGNESPTVRRTDLIGLGQSVIRLTATGDISDFVTPSGQVTVRVIVTVNGSQGSKTWNYDCDRVAWTVRP